MSSKFCNIGELDLESSVNQTSFSFDNNVNFENKQGVVCNTVKDLKDFPQEKDKFLIHNSDQSTDFEGSLIKAIESSPLNEIIYLYLWDKVFNYWVDQLHRNNRMNTVKVIRSIISLLGSVSQRLEGLSFGLSSSLSGDMGDVLVEKVLTCCLKKYLVSTETIGDQNPSKSIVNTNLVYELILHLCDSCSLSCSEATRCIQNIIQFSQLSIATKDDINSNALSVDNCQSREKLIDSLIMQLCKAIKHHNSIIRIEIVGILIYAFLAVPMSSKFPYNPTRIVQALVWSMYDDEEEVVCRAIDGLRVYLSVVGNDYFRTVINLAVNALPIERKQASPFTPLKILQKRILQNPPLPDIEDGYVTIIDFNLSNIIEDSEDYDSSLKSSSTENNVEKYNSQQIIYNNSKIDSPNNHCLIDSNNKSLVSIKVELNKEKVLKKSDITNFSDIISTSIDKIESIYQNSIHFLSTCELLTEDWNKVVEEITNLRRIIIFHSQLLNNNIAFMQSHNSRQKSFNATYVGESIIRWVNSLRSSVSKVALYAIEELYLNCGNCLDFGRFLDLSIDALLKRTTDRNKFLANDAYQAIKTICLVKCGDKLLGKFVNYGLRSRSSIIIHKCLAAIEMILQQIGVNILKCSHLLSCIEFIHSNINGSTPDIRATAIKCIRTILGNVKWKSISTVLQRSVAPFKLDQFRTDFERLIK
ncbi:uncharacterized protein CMU_014220 [Cryptosporidium muris RN66]|uniref:CLASP N-terminal domain-containing protein n=1 Tax=Cryptosporidium muris (strain RN66) TaxID=441375 RepID=B6AEX9_CRYMR|nr:uncharacterized protein CMU_014220 [Cryptosporidium muris RN66]EEA06746.1 hypothetical protein, conserved [Cryptosporidium muris RN66]|eukprot:XP_002141095.1 hypothetical protein [Cryptosporidium muris RN66]